MKKLIAGALLVALSGITSIARAEFAPEPRPLVAEAPARPVAQSTAPAPTSESGNYAQREAANPALGEFKGGDAAIYIGGSAITVLVVVLIILIIL